MSCNSTWYLLLSSLSTYVCKVVFVRLFTSFGGNDNKLLNRILFAHNMMFLSDTRIMPRGILLESSIVLSFCGRPRYLVHGPCLISCHIL